MTSEPSPASIVRAMVRMASTTFFNLVTAVLFHLPPVGALLLSAVLSATVEPDPAGDALVRQGYTRIKLYRDENDSLFCDVKFENKSHRFLLDTASASTTLGDEFANQQKIPYTKEGTVYKGWGGDITQHNGHIPTDKLTGPIRFSSRVKVADGFGVKFLQPLRHRKVVGILGTDALTHLSAVIDTSRGLMYTRDPWETEKGLVGEWQGVTAVVEGVTGNADYADGFKLQIKNGQARFSSTHTKFDVTYDINFVDTTADRKAFNWFSEDNDAPWRLIYKLTGDELTVCGAPDSPDAATSSKRPTEFISTKKDLNFLYSFRRVKTEKK